MQSDDKPIKPLGQRAYGSIPHLPNSRRGPADKGLSDQQAKLLTEKTRDKYDLVTVQEKLDGSNVAIANIDGDIVALIRAGYRADGSNYKMHHHFAKWAEINKKRFEALLKPNERVSGEWLSEAHGTRYNLPHEPFVAFDILTGNTRALAADVAKRCAEVNIITPRVIHVGGSMSVEAMLAVLEPSGHGALEEIEGAVWRMERKGVVDFLGKYVRSTKIDGKYLENVSGKPPVYNWTPPPSDS
jgi:RNA ligase